MNAIPIITTTDALGEFCQQLSQADFVAVDTEFMRQSTYWPELCLIQLACPTAEAIVDPLAEGIDLAPFYELMADKTTVKVFHAGRQDVEIIYNKSELIPLPAFDTQIAAMVCGFGEAVSYGALVKRLQRKNLDKSSRFTDWSRRPLTEKQLRYALGDVTHLCGIYVKLKQKLETSGRTSWVAEEMAELTDPANYRNEPADAWKRLKNRARSKSELSIMIELAAWREREAQRQNVPRNRIIKDDMIYDVMVQAPQTLDDLARLRTVHDGVARSQRGRDIVEVVKKALVSPIEDLPELPVHEPLPPTAVAAADLLRVLLKAVAAEHDVAAKLIANTDELDKIALDDEADVPALHGWRRELFGESALAIKAGRLAMTIRDGRIVTHPFSPVSSDQLMDGQPYAASHATAEPG